MDNLEEIDKFSERHSLPRLNHGEIESINRPITSTKIETMIKNLPTKESLGPDGFTASNFPPSICHEVTGPDAMIFFF